MAKEGHWRVLQGKGGQRPQARRAGPSHSRKQGQLLQIPSSREMSTGTQVRRAVIRMLGPTQFQYSKLTGRSCFLGPHPLVYFLPLLLGSRSWPANWRYLESVLKSQSFWTYKNHYPKRHGLDPWVRKIPGRRKWQPTPVFLPGKCHGQRSLAGYSPWGHRVGHDCDRAHPKSSYATTKDSAGLSKNKIPRAETETQRSQINKRNKYLKICKWKSLSYLKEH